MAVKGGGGKVEAFSVSSGKKDTGYQEVTEKGEG